MSKLLKYLLFGILTAFIVAGNVYATPIVTITEGGTTTQYTDDDNDGMVTYSNYGTPGLDLYEFILATSYPATGSVGKPAMHLTFSMTNLSNAPATLGFSVIDTFTQLDGGISAWYADFGGSPNGSATLLIELLDVNNLVIGEIADFDHNSDLTSYLLPTGDYKIKMTGTLTAGSNRGASIDASLSAVPEPATMMLFGIGLLGLAGITRKKIEA